MTLTGVGEREHLMSRSIRLATHIDDVAAVIETEELARVVLVGHSYAGLLITAVADRYPERMVRLVYVDAIVPRSGESWSSSHDETARQARRAGRRPPATAGVSLWPDRRGRRVGGPAPAAPSGRCV